jgi:hypothetical protein
MANSDDTGQSRVRAKERNNRRPGAGSKTPRKKGAQSGFGSNATKSGGIFRPLKGSGNSSLG